MTTRLLAILLLLATLIAFVPSAAAQPPGPQCGVGVMQCDWLIQKVKDAAEELDPRNWPCTCDPMPGPLGDPIS